jgi:crotonobetainyl-CoA:carnitine CoA-transferase CaiB-like acyl-CoA transferase
MPPMLQGLKVVEHATYHAAPGAGLILSEWGAQVIKVEPPEGDPVRGFFGSIGTSFEINPAFEFDNRGKRSIAVDARSAGGKQVMLKLAETADVFLTNVRPAGLARAGLDPDSLMRANPRLVYCSLTGYGLTGPDADRAGFDIASFWARSGMAALTAPKGVEPFPIRTAVGDHVTSLAAAAGILAALYEREKTGRGRLVEASLLRTATFTQGVDLGIQMAFGKLASTRPRSGAVQPLANFFRTGDGRWLCLVPRQTGDDWAAIRRALGLEALGQDARFGSAKLRRENSAALVAALDAAFADLSFAQASAQLDAEGLAWAPVQTAAEVVADPQLAAAGGVAEIVRADGSRLKTPAGPVRFPGHEDRVRPPAPAKGEHSRAILAELGYDATAIDALIAEKAVLTT